jgi:hypothetical protein
VRSWRQTCGAVALGAVAAFALTGSPATGQQTPALVRGGGHAGVETEPTFRFQTLQGNRSQADYDRAVLKVPAYYGEPFAVVAGTGGRQVIWYRADDGSLRNVIVGDDRSLVRVSPE